MSESRITMFCESPDEERGRYSLYDPFVVGGWRYATNGTICAREPAPDDPDTDDGRKLPMKYVAELFAAHPQCNDPPPELTDDAYDPCSECGGSGICTCKCGDEHPCPKCKGSGRESTWQDFGDGWSISGPILERIRELPGVKCLRRDYRLYFTADGGIQGLCALMENE